MSTRIKHVQDSTHGLMRFCGMETAVVDLLHAKEIQRLRRVRQLGLVHLVYPGAEHSRLVHSLGAAHLAIRFARQLCENSRGYLCSALLPNESAIRDVALGALVHDLGHGPFSHVWEHAVVGKMTTQVRSTWIKSLGLEKKAETLAGVKKWHELVTQGLLNWEKGDLHQLLEKIEIGTSDRICRFLVGQYYLPYMPRIISSDIDVDRCDFMLRDAKQAGVTYGNFDLHWLLSNFTIGMNRIGKLVVGFDMAKTDRAVEQFILARRAMYEKVYYHRAVKSAETMLGLIMSRIKTLFSENKPVPCQGLNIFKPIFKLLQGKGLTPEEILKLDDYLVWSFIEHIASSRRYDPTLIDLTKRLVNRTLFKTVACDDASLDKLTDRRRLSRLHRILQSTLEGVKPEYYYKVDSAPITLFSLDDEDCAYFIDHKRNAKPLAEHPLLRPWVDQPARRFLFVPEEAKGKVEELLRQ